MQRAALIFAALLYAICLAAEHAPDFGGAGQLTAVVVEETAERTARQADVLLSPKLDEFRRSGTLKIVDRDVAGPDAPQVQWAIDAAKPAIEANSLPVICLKRGSRITVKNLPKTADEAVKLFKSYGG